MPTIDQLAPATAASDSDELLVSQNGIARKATRAQILAGVQPQLAISSATLVGRHGAGMGGPEQIAIGTNLILNNGTLSANGSPFVVASLAAGNVPNSSDLVVLGQGGSNTSVTYNQFMSGMAGVSNIDATQLLVLPTGGKNSTKLGDLAANSLQLTGGTLTGALNLGADPSTALQAATKRYVDNQTATALPKTGGTLMGSLVLPTDPVAPMHAATKQYVDGQTETSMPRSGGAFIGPLSLAEDPSSSMQAATKQYVDTRLSRSGDTLTGALVLAADPATALQAATKSYVDIQVASALPKAGGTITGTLSLAGDPATTMQAATKQYVDTRVSRNGDTLTGPLMLAGDPTVAMQAVTKGYVDGQIGMVMPKAGGIVTGALTLAADPSASLQAATKQYVDLRVSRSGDSLTGALVLAADPTLALQAATKAYVDNQVSSSLPKSGGTLTGALVLAADPSAPSQAATKRYVDTQVGTSLPVAGGTLTGALTLATDPVAPLQPATKRYVDSSGAGATAVINVRSYPYNALINGISDDTAAFKAAYQAAPAGSVIYVPNGITVMQSPNTWGIPLTKRVKWIIDGTSLPDGTSLANAIPGGTGPANSFLPGIVVGNSAISAEISQNGSQPTDFAVLHSSYIVNHAGGPTGGSVTANTRNDTIIYNSPNNYVWGGVDRLLWCGSQTPSAGSTAQHVGRYIQTIRQNIGTDTSGKALPQPSLWSTCLEYRDTTGRPSSWAAASLTVEMDWFGNGADDANQRQIQSLVVGQHNTSGAPVEISTVVGVYLAGGSTGHAYRVFGVDIPFSSAVLDTTSAQQMPGAAAIRLAAGHAIAFERTNSCALSYDSSSNTLRWNQGTLSYPVGKGITVGWLNVYGGNATIPNFISGNMIFLVGNGSPYTITLPASLAVAAGTGFTFSVLGSAAVTIVTGGSDIIDNGPINLRQNDRYHIVSDPGAGWREVFRTNAVNPHFSGPLVLPSYVVSSLPTSPGAGAKAFVSNGRKPADAAGAGTGVEAFHDGIRWISVCSGVQVLA